MRYKPPTTISIQDTYELINIAIATANIKSLKTPFASIRPSMHTILCGKPGTLKSSILYDICKHFKQTPYFNLTAANLVGSVDSSTGEPMLPAVWECRGGILPIDDFYVDKDHPATRNSLRMLLSVLENPEYTKKISYRCNNYEKKSKGLYCIVKDGNIKVKTRFVLVANTMQNYYREQKMIELEALRSRCLTIPYYPSIEEINLLIDNEGTYKYQDYNIKPDVEVKLDEYKKIKQMVMDARVKVTDYVRTIGDCLRAYSIVGNNDEIYRKIISLKLRG